ncbi:hypothetical protein [Pseudomonas sp. SCB32]|uniref:hypothetical protein n=1 Tax=Pseudomonas sp. SCB32 TaxID=2653853 RepID=UPI001263FF57|nr:hypothetical protein [Pseudomonas sp. SCB32]
MSPKEWLYVWKQIPRSLQRDLFDAVPVLILGFFGLVFAAGIGIIIALMQLANYLRQHDSPYPGMSDAHFTYCLKISRDTLEARQALERLGPTPPAGVATDSAYARVDRLAGEYSQYCAERIWKKAFEAGLRERGVPPATSPEGWLAADRF